MPDDKIKAIIVQMLSNAAHNLDGALCAYWPVVNKEKNGLQESNLVSYFSHQALSENFFVYPEASNHNFESGHSRIDLLALKPGSAIILIEAKKLYSAEKAQEMVADYQKMKDFGFSPNAPKDTPKYALLLAITTSQSTKDWWNEPYEWDEGKSWDNLKELLDKSILRSYIELSANKHQYILYALFRLP